MSAFLVRWPDGFVPEEHGWELHPQPIECQEMWMRWRVPYRFPALICRFLHDEATGAVGGWFMPAEGSFPAVATLGEIHAEMLGEPTSPAPDQRPICGCSQDPTLTGCEG